MYLHVTLYKTIMEKERKSAVYKGLSLLCVEYLNSQRNSQTETSCFWVYIASKMESPCAYAQGTIPATSGHTALGQLSVKLHLSSHMARTIPCVHRVHSRAYARGIVPR